MQDEPRKVNDNRATVINEERGNRPHSHGFVRELVEAFRRPEVVLLIATYAVLCLIWAWFSYGVVPNVITAAYNERSLTVLKWLLQGHESAPIEHYLDRWSDIATAVQIATILHLGIVLFIQTIDRKHRLLFLPRADQYTNIVLIAFAAAFLALTILSGVHGDYTAYLLEWKVVLAGHIPWKSRPINAYGPLFNVLAPLVWVNPLANKLLFAASYLVYVVWLIKDFAPRRALVALPWPWLVFWLLNPFPWVQIAYFGYFDVLVAVACVAAIHSLVGGKDGVSGNYLAFGILLKYMPIVILPFLVFSERRFRFRVLSFCVGVVIVGLSVSVLIWGRSTFWPLLFAATRPSHYSIYDVLASTHSPLRMFWDSPKSLDWLEKPFLITAGLGVFWWCMLRRTGPALSAALAVLVTLLFYRVGFIQYQMVLLFLISYWVVSKWPQLEEHPVRLALLACYFALLAVLDLIHWSEFTPSYQTGDITYINLVVVRFLLGCTLLAVLAQFSASRHYN
jgi:Glycosyltransferase family 87